MKNRTFKMYVRVLIQSEHNKILLLKKQSKNNNNIWEIPGAEVTDEENFDDVAITSIHEKTGYLITTDKIVGITEFENRLEKRNEVHIIMEADIISGNLNIIDPYDGYSWIEKYKIKEYPLASWLKKYIKENPTPFEDVQEELNKELGERPQQIFDDDEKEEIKETFTEETDAVKETVKGSLSLLKETIIRTFKPRQIDVDKTTPKDFPIYKDNPNVEETQYSPDISLKQESIKEDENEIIPEHAIQTEEIIPETANIEETIPETKEEIMIDHTEEIIPEHVPTEEIIPETTNIEETIPETKEEIMIDHTEETIPEHVPTEETIPEVTNIEETIPEVTNIEETIPEETPIKKEIPKNSQEKIDVVEEIIPDHVQKEVKSEEIPEHMKTKDRTKRPTKTTPKRKEKMQRYTSQTIRRDHSNNKPQIRNAPTQNNAELNRKLKRREQELKKRIERKNKRKEEEARKKAPKPKGRR